MMQTLSEYVITSRLTHCNKCSANNSGICLDCKLTHPDRDCDIHQGVQMVKAECPRLLWAKEYSIVWVYHNVGLNGLEYSINSVKKFLPHHNMFVCGDHTHLAETINTPRTRNSIYAKWHDSLTKLQRIIDHTGVTDDFLWMYDDTFFLAPNTIRNVAQPKYSTSPPENKGSLWYCQLMHTLSLTESKYNYSTHYPVVYNKHLLQHVLDTYKPPYLVETLYLNLYGKHPIAMDNSFQFSRDCVNWKLKPETTVLNVKRFTPTVQAALTEIL